MPHSPPFLRLPSAEPACLLKVQKHAMHRTHIFIVLHTGQIEPLRQSQYVQLLRGEVTLPDYANETVRLADWYVEVTPGRPVAVHSETYSLLHIDEKGHVRDAHDRRGATANSAFYDALRRSSYSDPDDDPAVQRLRKELRSEYAWAPSDEERTVLHALVFATAPHAA